MPSRLASITPGTWNRSIVYRISGNAVWDRSPRYWKLFSTVGHGEDPSVESFKI